MKKNKVLLLALILTAFQLNAQFLRTYSPGTAQETYSMRGYDLTKDDGKYYYTAGNEVHKVIFEIDPANGAILTPSTKIATFNNSGSKTGIGKNSVALAPYFQDPNDPFGPPCCFNTMYLTGMAGSTVTGITFESHGVYDNGSTFNSYVRTGLNAPFMGPGTPPNYWLRDADYADQVTYQDYRYMVSNRGSVVSGTNEMFVVKHHNGIGSSISTEFVSGTAYGLSPDVPTRTINDPAHGVMTVFGGSVHNGTYYTNNPVRMDPGMWWVDHSMNTTVYKTYHNASGIANENFGVAQSVINVNEGQSNQHSLIVTSGNNPQSTSYSSDQFQMGRWDRNCFHILKDWDYTGVATEALRLSFIDQIHANDPYGTFYQRLQVGDIVEVSDGFLIVGSLIRSEQYEGVDGSGLPFSAVDEYDQIFMVKLNKPTNYPIGNLTFGYAKFFLNFPIDGLDVDEVQANRVKVIDGEVYIIGSYSSIAAPNERTPLLIKTDIDNQIDDCSIPLGANLQELSVYEVNVDDEGSSAPASVSAKYHTNGIQHVAPSVVSCLPPVPADYALSGSSIEALEELDVFPNPANDQITISGMTAGSATIVIMDLKGKTVLESTGNVTSLHNLSISRLDNGVYFLQVTQNGQIRSMKLIKS